MLALCVWHVMEQSDKARDHGDHVVETVEQLTRMHATHSAQTSSLQRRANRITAALGRPMAFLVIFAIIVAWIIGNVAAKVAGRTALEEFPFAGFHLIGTIAALLIALLILSTQRHQDELADKRAQLTMQLAALSEKKIAKVIELLEQERRDNPMLPDRNDVIANKMAKPVDATTDLVEREDS